MRSLLGKLLTPAMLWLLRKRFIGQEIVTIRTGGAWGPVYCRGVTFKRTEEGVKFFLRCYEDPHPVLHGKGVVAVRVLDYQEITRRPSGIWFHETGKL